MDTETKKHRQVITFICIFLTYIFYDISQATSILLTMILTAGDIP